mgnify:FL=1
MKKIASLLVAGLATGLSGVAAAGSPCPASQATHVQVGGQTFRVEVATTEPQRQTGLSGRPSLPGDAGMLFLMPEAARHAFWMPDMAFAIDLVWIDARQVVLGAETLVPCGPQDCPQHVSPGPALYVLEVNAGRFAGRPGDPFNWTCAP